MPTIQEQKDLIRKMLASTPESWIAVGALIISHSSWPTVYTATDYYGGFTKNDHNGAPRVWNFVPVIFDIPSVSGDIDCEFKIVVSDLNNDGTPIGTNKAIRDLVDLIPVDSVETPKVTVLSYISYLDGTFSEYCDGPYEFDVTDITFSDAGASIVAKSPDALYASCGEIYTIERFPMLKQFL